MNTKDICCYCGEETGFEEGYMIWETFDGKWGHKWCVQKYDKENKMNIEENCLQQVKWREVPFEIMLKCDEEIKCEHWLLNNSYKTGGVDLRKPMLFNEFLKQIGTHLTGFNCKSLFQQAKWFVIDDGVQPDLFME